MCGELSARSLIPLASDILLDCPLSLFFMTFPLYLQEGSAGCAGADISLPITAASFLIIHTLPPSSSRVCRSQPSGTGWPGKSAAMQEIPYQLLGRGKLKNWYIYTEFMSCTWPKFSSCCVWKTCFSYSYTGSKHRGGQWLQRGCGHCTVEAVCWTGSWEPSRPASFRQCLPAGR